MSCYIKTPGLLIITNSPALHVLSEQLNMLREGRLPSFLPTAINLPQVHHLLLNVMVLGQQLLPASESFRIEVYPYLVNLPGGHKVQSMETLVAARVCFCILILAYGESLPAAAIAPDNGQEFDHIIMSLMLANCAGFTSL
ncbi:hypothetical protein DACRYDRAFT_106800 [Dacryopinax primogenitus]|uniref:Uncharacterized protein n=1 Tax=Dacryopinax primogenitus (strain DJM 731) TaxID=1858805 RepID=M5G3E2_DACPD|nr:uncharacterized protein DACRYDRAFT_106800 [Dacryopinax primogenitus]EJU02740.1 hypothetical protein DACRYDRAFT_106800 [Dacryopinax primogenitus]